MVSVGARAYTGVCGRPPAGSRDKAPRGLKLKAFCTFLYVSAELTYPLWYKWSKVKDLSENLPRV